MHEIEVIRQTRAFLQRDGLLGHRVLDLYTDAHPTLLADTALRPFQRFTLAFESFSVHPDLVGRLSDGETTFAVEAKGTDDLLRGIAQADSYRAGFHLVLFASAGAPSRDLLAMARQRDVGVLAVRAGQVEVLDLPPPHLPQLRHARSIQQQLVATATLSRQFAFNLPTHYLCFVPLLAVWHQHHSADWADLTALEPFTRARYHVLPAGRSSFRAALSGAEKLGLVHVRGPQAQLSYLGWSVAPLLPDAPSLAAIHQRIAPKGSGRTLASESPAAGAVLRTLLHGDPVALHHRDAVGARRRASGEPAEPGAPRRRARSGTCRGDLLPARGDCYHHRRPGPPCVAAHPARALPLDHLLPVQEHPEARRCTCTAPAWWLINPWLRS
jgi:hypothetical protein